MTLHEMHKKIWDTCQNNHGEVTFKFNDGTSKVLKPKQGQFHMDFENDKLHASITTFEHDAEDTTTYNLLDITDVE
jgi:hypothetical protein